MEKDGKAIERKISRLIEIKAENGKIILHADNATRREKKQLGTIKAHLMNMIKGLQEPFVYKLQICSVHFPMNVTVDESAREVVIKNFLGEVKERRAKILEGVDVSINNDIIEVSSHDIEKAGQTAANIEQATRITNRDRRIFQDGIYIIEKPKKKIL